MLGYSLNSVTIVLGLLRLGKEGLAQCVFSKNKTVEWPQRGPARPLKGLLVLLQSPWPGSKC